MNVLKPVAVAIYILTFCSASLLGYNSIKKVYYYWNVGYKSQSRFKLALHIVALLTCGTIIALLLSLASGSKIWIVNITPGFGVHSYSNYSSDMLVLITIFLFILFLFLADLYIKEEHEINMKNHQEDIMDIILNILNKNEKTVIQELMSVREMTQVELQKRTGISKATLSRTLKSLENKGLIVRFRAGMTNKVKLKNPSVGERPHPVDTGISK